ncbi:MAG: hypothetical protein MHM6MM_000372 [Cercozoa sp. M6MM]
MWKVVIDGVVFGGIGAVAVSRANKALPDNVSWTECFQRAWHYDNQQSTLHQTQYRLQSAGTKSVLESPKKELERLQKEKKYRELPVPKENTNDASVSRQCRTAQSLLLGGLAALSAPLASVGVGQSGFFAKNRKSLAILAAICTAGAIGTNHVIDIIEKDTRVDRSLFIHYGLAHCVGNLSDDALLKDLLVRPACEETLFAGHQNLALGMYTGGHVRSIAAGTLVRAFASRAQSTGPHVDVWLGMGASLSLAAATGMLLPGLLLSAWLNACSIQLAALEFRMRGRRLRAQKAVVDDQGELRTFVRRLLASNVLPTRKLCTLFLVTVSLESSQVKSRSRNCFLL